ncbi:amino acid adenylation domain-containing protein [Actinokineospora sp. G85]|uniref:amino acid adenylation domain-containing protein n=1 Tax=Actinokineospora sp. G85 TaxID=3406626 RepID=UPI003C75121A
MSDTSPLTAARRALLAKRLLDRRAPAERPRARHDGVAPLSSAQRRLYFLDRYRPGSPAYLAPAAFEVTGPLDVAALRRALDALVRRHEALRTTFTERDGAPVQVVGEPGPVDLRVDDLTALDPAERAARLRSAAAAQDQDPMDLATGPLLRARLSRTGSERHQLVLTLHHIIADGWTLNLLVRDLADLYAGVPLDEPLLQAADHALRERETLAGQAAEDDLAWWTAHLAGLPTVDFPADRPRPAVQGWAGARHAFTIPPALAAGVRELAERSGTTAYTVLLAAYQAVLHRWTGQDDFAVGTPVAGRDEPELEGMAGLVANTVVVRADLTGQPTFADLLARVSAVALESFSRQGTPFDELVDRLDRERDPSRHPLFQIAFTLHNLPGADHPRLGGATLRQLDMTGDVAKFDLNMSIAEDGPGLRGDLEYSTDLFDEATAVRLVDTFTTLLRAAVADPSTRLGDLPLMDADDRRAALALGCGDTVPVPTEPVHRLFERRARQAPDAPAIVDGDAVVTYGELDRRASALARRLGELGAGPEVLVGVGLERSAEQVLACLAVLKAGAAFVPLDPGHPADRLAAVRADADLRLLVTDHRLRPRFPMGRTAVVCVEDATPLADGEPGASSEPGHLAYVIYTSGSTGRPKGVAVEHGNLANLVAWHSGEYGLGPGERTALLASPAFDASVWEVWPVLASGAALHVAPEAARTDPAVLTRWLADAGITVTFVTTALGEAVLATPWPAHGRLRALLTGGEALVRRPDPATPFRVVNHYGPTETTAIVTGATVDPAADRLPPIGRPLSNVQAHVLDRWGQPVPAGVPGELFIGGAQVARGYLGDARRTAQRFVPDPFSARPGARLYATGDVVRRLADGQVEFVGRVDDQVKVRGFRIELGEVEVVLRGHPAVADAAVVVRDGPGGRALAGFAVPEPGPPPSAAELRQHVKGLLPHYMVPAHIAVVEALPLNANAKVDRKALAALPAADGAVADLAPPRGATEELVAQVWREVLEVAGVGADDNFFDLGGHSFLALRVQTRVREALGREVPVVALFQHPTVADFAAYLDSGDQQAPRGRGDRRRAALRARRDREG